MTNPHSIGLKEYSRLLKLSEALVTNSLLFPEIKIAILGEHATQQLCKLIRAVLYERGFWAFIYEAEFDTLAQETLDSNSKLYSFEPDLIYFSICTQKLRERYYNLSTEKRSQLIQQSITQLKNQILKVAIKKIPFIVNTLALPLERQFGSYSLMTDQSFYGLVLRFNEALVNLTKETSGYINDVMYLSATFGAKQFLSEKYWCLSRSICSNQFLPDIAKSFSSVLCATLGKLTKLIVVDLDNTLWGGTIGDDGVAGILLDDSGPGEHFLNFQKYILSLKNRGYLLAVCSKNDESTARKAFREHSHMALKETDFTLFVANWNNKASNIEYICRVLNLGIDSVIVLDDSIFERELISTRFPKITVPTLPADPADYIEFLESSNLFEVHTFSGEDLLRSEFYAQKLERDKEVLQFENINEYLRALEMKLSCSPFTGSNLHRIVQLSGRSNQFNLRTQRLSTHDCTLQIKNQHRYYSYAYSLKDKHGDSGTIAVLSAEWETYRLKINEWVMSCRILKRGVEHFIMNRMVEECKRKQIPYIWGEYIPTEKNNLVSSLFENFGFEKINKTNSSNSEYLLEVKNYHPFDCFIKEEIL